MSYLHVFWRSDRGLTQVCRGWSTSDLVILFWAWVERGWTQVGPHWKRLIIQTTHEVGPGSNLLLNLRFTSVWPGFDQGLVKGLTSLKGPNLFTIFQTFHRGQTGSNLGPNLSLPSPKPGFDRGLVRGLTHPDVHKVWPFPFSTDFGTTRYYVPVIIRRPAVEVLRNFTSKFQKSGTSETRNTKLHNFRTASSF